MMRKIEVDEDVWSFLKKNAEPFEDTPNSVLRRLLFGNDLEVTYLVKKQGYTRSEATNLVAKRRGIAPQTVIDKYCRQLNKKAFEIDRLLEQDIGGFKSLVERTFVKHNKVIADLFETIKES